MIKSIDCDGCNYSSKEYQTNRSESETTIKKRIDTQLETDGWYIGEIIRLCPKCRELSNDV